MRALSRSLLVALVLVGCVGCDQISKAAAREYLPGSGIHSYLGDTLRLQYAQNPGAFLSLGESLPPAIRFEGFTIAVGAFVVVVLGWALLSNRLSWRHRLAITAIGAGGLGNLLDRLRFDGAVTDFLNLGIGSLRTGIFNVADTTLMVGVILLILTWSPRHAD
jgi:signal peptidase II